MVWSVASSVLISLSTSVARSKGLDFGLKTGLKACKKDFSCADRLSYGGFIRMYHIAPINWITLDRMVLCLFCWLDPKGLVDIKALQDRKMGSRNKFQSADIV